MKKISLTLKITIVFMVVSMGTLAFLYYVLYNLFQEKMLGAEKEKATLIELLKKDAAFIAKIKGSKCPSEGCSNAQVPVINNINDKVCEIEKAIFSFSERILQMERQVAQLSMLITALVLHLLQSLADSG